VVSIDSRVGTKVFAFVFSLKFSLKFTFRFRKSFFTKRQKFRESFRENKMFDFAKTHGKKSINGKFSLLLLLKILGRSLSSVKMMWFCNKFHEGGDKSFRFRFVAKVFAKFNFCIREKILAKLQNFRQSFRENLIFFRTRAATLRL
jgi:hypothetical protein